MARRKKRRKVSTKRKSAKRVRAGKKAARTRRRNAGKTVRTRKKGRRSAKGHIPLPILVRRTRKLVALVRKRGGAV